ncbi:MAG: hypothetical protein FWH21_00135 [Kiritimatiellaeota bacterium]|nr:hypothetical protein [Kiritimatiellota bacterium]
MKSPAQIIMDKAILPTHLSSREARGRISADIRRTSIFSARTAEAAYLKEMRDVCADAAAGRISDETARDRLRAWLDASGYVPESPGSLTDLGSRTRLQLILDTQRTMAESVASVNAQTAGTLEAYPAWELVRVGSAKAPRQDWAERWAAAGDACGWEGASRAQMAARKDSPVWQALGDGAGGFGDTLGNPYPPFAFGSTLEWVPVDREEAGDLGITGTPLPGEQSLSPDEDEIARALRDFGPEFTENLLMELGIRS